MSNCICYIVDEKYWTTHYGAVEPGSTMEPNPDCPEHFPKEYRIEKCGGLTVYHPIKKQVTREAHWDRVLTIIEAENPRREAFTDWDDWYGNRYRVA